MLIVSSLGVDVGGASRRSAELHAFPVEAGLVAGAEYLQRTGFAHGIGANEDPVLPSGEAAEDPCFHGLGDTEAEVRFQAGQRVRRQTRALLEGYADFLGPVEVVGRGGDQAELERLTGGECATLGFFRA